MRPLEYLTSVKQNHLPLGLDNLAHRFLSTYQIVLSLQASLEECSRTLQCLPADLPAELEKEVPSMPGRLQYAGPDARQISRGEAQGPRHHGQDEMRFEQTNWRRRFWTNDSSLGAN